MVDQGLLPPNQAAPTQVGPAPTMPNQVTATPTQSSAALGVAPAMSAPQPQRDYQSNPLNERDQVEFTRFQIVATKVIHNPEIRTKIVDRIKGQDHPYTEIADASLVVMQRVEQEGIKNKKPWDDAIKLLGGMSIVEQVTEVAQASGKVPAEIPHQDYRVIYGEAVQKYYQQKIASGEISKEQAAQDAHMLAKQQAQMNGDDTGEIDQRLGATAKLQQQGINAPANAAMPGGQLKVPEPAADPMHPATTMKEVLASGQGGLLNG